MSHAYRAAPDQRSSRTHPCGVPASQRHASALASRTLPLACAAVLTLCAMCATAQAEQRPSPDSQATQENQPSQRLACTFELGNAWSYQGGEYASETPQPLSFDVADIDLEAQTAKLYTSAEKPPGPLRVVRAINANHFIEVANEGFLNLTTIYDPDPQTGASPAVHSRHFGFLGQPIFAQYAGSCRPK